MEFQIRSMTGDVDRGDLIAGALSMVASELKRRGNYSQVTASLFEKQPGALIDVTTMSDAYEKFKFTGTLWLVAFDAYGLDDCDHDLARALVTYFRISGVCVEHVVGRACYGMCVATFA